MLLKLRQKRRRRPPRDAHEALPGRCNLFIHNWLARHDTTVRRIEKLAADVHLCSVDKYGESTAVHQKVLIVDDSPAEVTLMQGLLEKEGYWPHALHDAQPGAETSENER